MPILPEVLRIKCHGQTSLKIALVILGLIFMSFKNLKSIDRKNEKLDVHKPFPTLRD